MVVVEVIVERVLNGSLESHEMQERNREEEVKKREGILVTREMGGPGQADSGRVVCVFRLCVLPCGPR